MSTPETPKREWPGSAASVILATATIAETGKAHADELTAVDTTLTADYFTDLHRRDDAAARDYLGADSAEALRKANTDFKASHESAKHELGLSKTFIEGKFDRHPDRKKEILTHLGMDHLADATAEAKGEKMDTLLKTFDKSLGTDLENELTQLGFPPARVQLLRGLAITYHDQRVDKNVQAGVKKELSAEGVKVFNGLYAEAIYVCKMAQRCFTEKSPVRNRFVYSKIAGTGSHPDNADGTAQTGTANP